MKFLKKYLKDFTSETVFSVTNSRKVLAREKDNKNIDAVTNAFLKPKQKWDWHMHNDIDEIAIVIKGKGVFGFKNKELEYAKNEAIFIPAQSLHKWQARKASEFFFIRIKKQ